MKAQSKWSCSLGVNTQIEPAQPLAGRSLWRVSPLLQLERSMLKNRPHLYFILSNSIQVYQKNDSQLLWTYSNLLESYELTNWMLGIGILAKNPTENKVQLLAGGRFVLGVPLHWNYSMDNIQPDGVDLRSGGLVNTANLPQRLEIRAGLCALTGWQLTLGAQLRLKEHLHLRFVATAGHFVQLLRLGLSFAKIDREINAGSKYGFSLALVYDW